MKVALIGAGNVATHLGRALVASGHEVVGICSRTMASARRLATDIGAPLATDSIARMAGQANDDALYIISVKDDAVASVGAALAESAPRALVVHTAGSLPMDTLRSRRRGVLYPMQTFSRERAVDFAAIPLFIEASSADDLRLLHALSGSLSDNVYEMSSAERAYLHIAAVFCCNFANHLATLAAGLLARHDIPFSVMLPLLDETTRKLHHLPPLQAQTGPAVRGDRTVVATQHALLQQEGEQHMADIYQLLSESIFRQHGH